MMFSMKRTSVFIGVSFAFYIVAIFIGNSLLSGIVAALCDLLAFGLIFQAVFTSANKQFKANYIFIGLAVLSWALADLLWLLYAQVFHMDPDESIVITVLYAGTNVGLLIATVLYLYKRLRKWDTVMLLQDAAFFSTAIIWLFWSIPLNKNQEFFSLLMNVGTVNSICILIDFFQILLIGVWYLSVRKGKIPPFLIVLAVSILLFSIVDLVYYYLYALGLYVPDTLIDACYLVNVLGFAIAVKLYYTIYPQSYATDGEAYSNIGSRKKGLLLFICPFMIILFKGFDLFDIAFFLLLILMHELASRYIQVAIHNKVVLQQEMEMNNHLEQLVSSRTCDLESVNTELAQKYAELEFINIHDSLTGLYNRQYFLERLEQHIAGVSTEQKFALLFWNIDHLKGINDTYGHNTGDQLIKLLGQRFQAVLGSAVLLARIGGDEFACVVDTGNQSKAYDAVAMRITAICEQPAEIGLYVLHVTVSVGIAVYPQDAEDAPTLLKNADVAMRLVKDQTADAHILHYSDVDLAMKRQYRIQSNLMKADFDSEFSLHFQPQFRIANRSLIGMEALLRWNCPDMGPISPAEFIPIAEKDNLIIPIGNWVIQNAIRQIAEWNATYHTKLRMGINISPKQLGQASTLASLKAAVARYNAVFEWIDIEITESIALDNEKNAANIKKLFGGKGVTISIDDFGTGYSSLGYLSMLSFDRLKIAKPLVDQIVTDESTHKIVASIILLAKSLGLATIAEGVETKQQLELLFALGCDQIQGFYLGKPLPADNFVNAYLLPALR